MKFTGSIFLLLSGLAFAVDTEVRVTGLRKKSERQVLDLLGGRLEHVHKHAASASRADDAAFVLRKVLQNDGFAQVRVDWKIVHPREIQLIVQEGMRLSLKTVTINGVEDSEDTAKLVKIYSNPAIKARPLGAGSPPFREEDVEVGLGYLRQELNAQGYWAAEVTLVSRTIDPASGDVTVVINIHEGARHRIASPKIVWSQGEGVSQTFDAAQQFVGRSATTGNINSMRAAVEESFVSKGYPDAKIYMGRTIADGKFIPEFTIDLGKRVKLRNVHVAGLQRTREYRIQQRLKPMVDDWYNEAAMNKRLRGFLATGAFSSARVEKIPVDDDTVDVRLDFAEAKAREISFAAGFGSYQGFITRATYTDRNLWGMLYGLNMGVELGSRGVLGEAKITDPWLFGTDTSVSARIYALIYGHEGYSTFETGAEGTLGWKFGDHYALDVVAGYSFINTTSEGLPFSQLGETVYAHPRLAVTQSIDFRDSKVLPKNGWHLETPFEIGAAIGETSTSYLKGGVSSGWYMPVGKRYDFAIGGDLSVMMPSADVSQLPIDMRLFNGGARSVRSFPERELGPSLDGYPTGGEGMWVASAELTRTISGSLKAVTFVDAGGLSRDYEELMSSKVNVAVGLGLRLELPIGPVRLEYGYNMTRGDDEPTGALHFAIGSAF
ncbi:MAG: BamA/TamA family outer membrane protein [Luteolibacter sp.]